MSFNITSRLNFDESTLFVAAGGMSILDQPRLHIKTLEEAEAFIKSYGFDVHNETDLRQLWYFHRRALVLLTERLKFPMTQIPSEIHDKELLGDIRKLLLFASQDKSSESQRWACAFLRCMHVFVHSETDLFSFFSEEIQKQIIIPFEQCITHEDKMYLRSLKKDGGPNRVELSGFHTKPFKTSTSTVIKLLAKPDAIAMRVLDKIGVRFVTKTIFDSFQVIRFLEKENLISIPQIMPDQSSNNMYPVKDFMEVCQKIVDEKLILETLNSEDVDQILIKHIEKDRSLLGMFRKENPFSSQDFKYIKFISRRMINIQPRVPGGRSFHFFYPYEVQIMTEDTFNKMQTGESEHNAYKDRQTKAAIKRLFPE